jgi:hypothetical protein
MFNKQKKPWYEDLFTANDGKPLEWMSHVVNNNKLRVLERFVEKQNEYSGFVLLPIRIDNGHIDPYITENLTQGDAIVTCAKGAIEVAK